jgi:hypothetical protein
MTSFVELVAPNIGFQLPYSSMKFEKTTPQEPIEIGLIYSEKLQKVGYTSAISRMVCMEYLLQAYLCVTRYFEHSCLKRDSHA